ncbi:uncharacterized protein DS421_1g14480 [Arachis hypogaea]|nr:uncharacterized protein DS421_1g14480 [Arachis hypogaea]
MNEELVIGDKEIGRVRGNKGDGGGRRGCGGGEGLRVEVTGKEGSGGLVEASGTKNEDKDVSHKSSMGIKIIIVCLSVVDLLALSVFLFKLWQNKRREAQHARLLKLFKDDDELEVELGRVEVEA